jgi:hypothetical protein
VCVACGSCVVWLVCLGFFLFVGEFVFLFVCLCACVFSGCVSFVCPLCGLCGFLFLGVFFGFGFCVFLCGFLCFNGFPFAVLK